MGTLMFRRRGGFLGPRFSSQLSRFIDLPPEQVMARIRRARSWPEWRPEMVSSEGPEPLAEGDVVRGKARMLGFHVTGEARITSAGPNLVEQDVIVGVLLHVRYDARPERGGVELTHRLVTQLPGGISGRVLSFFLRRRLRQMQRAELDNLAARHGREGKAERT